MNGVFTIIILLLLGALAWCVLKLVRAVYRHVNLEVVERIVIEDGVEMRLNDGSRWRSKGNTGLVWHSFPDGNRAYLELEFFLDHENDRLRLLEKWSEDS